MVIKIKTTNSFLKRCDLHKLAWNGMVYTKKLLNRNSIDKYFVGAKVDRFGELLKANIKTQD